MKRRSRVEHRAAKLWKSASPGDMFLVTKIIYDTGRRNRILFNDSDTLFVVRKIGETNHAKFEVFSSMRSITLIVPLNHLHKRVTLVKQC